MADAQIRPAAGGWALVVIDMITDLGFAAGEALRPAAENAADAILELRGQADAAGVPTVYVNDNYGQWHSDAPRLVAHCRREGSRGGALLDRLEPRPDDYFVIKPQFSGFYSTNLPVLLPKLGADKLILTGLAADICVLFTAGDAHMRDYGLWVPEDAVAAASAERKRWALEIMAQSMHADTRPTTEIRVEALLAENASGG